eukprot:scaffold8439_cov140-Cylindrotheca_fusiformis.AAC.1
MVVVCLLEDKPIPAFETFEYRSTLPTRYFFFFDTFLKAGRHNKEAWREALEAEEKWRSGEIATDGTARTNKKALFKRFCTCLLEAHVLTTIEENYFF